MPRNFQKAELSREKDPSFSHSVLAPQADRDVPPSIFGMATPIRTKGSVTLMSDSITVSEESPDKRQRLLPIPI